MSNNLDLTQVSENQANADVAINDKGGQLDAAVTETLVVDVTAGNVTVTAANYRRAIHLLVSNASVARTVTLPAVKRAVMVESDAANTAIVTIKVGTTSFTLDHGKSCWVYTDGTTNGLVQVGAAGGGTSAIEFIIGDGANVPGTGIQGYLEIPFDCEIQVGTLLADQTGSVVIDVFKCSYSAFDVTTHPVSGDKITGSAPLTISSAVKSQDNTLTGWTKTLSAGDILAFNLNSVTSITRVTVSLKVSR